MAKNKNTFERLKILDSFFKKNSNENTVGKILERLKTYDINVSRRTIYNDINYLTDETYYNAPLKKEKVPFFNEIKYYYEDSNFSIINSPVVEKDKNAIKEAIEYLSQFTNIKGFENIDSIITQLKANLDINQTVKPIVSLSENNKLKGIEHLRCLLEYIKSETVLSIKYQPFHQEEILEITISPYLLKEFNQRWFLFGQNHGHMDYIQNLALDRIVEIKKLEKIKYIPTDIDFKKYFHSVIGVTIPSEKVEKIKLKFSAKRLPYIVTKPIHDSQVNLENNIIQLTLKINPELISLILSYGGDVEVLEPQSLVDRMKQEALKMVNTYNLAIIE